MYGGGGVAAGFVGLASSNCFRCATVHESRSREFSRVHDSSVLQRVAACGSVWQRVAACCSVLQRVAACCMNSCETSRLYRSSVLECAVAHETHSCKVSKCIIRRPLCRTRKNTIKRGSALQVSLATSESCACCNIELYRSVSA